MSRRHVLVTGAASGIGRACVDQLAQRGERVTALDIDLDALQASARAGGWSRDDVCCARLDIRDAAQWQIVTDAAEARFGPIDVGMNVAGVLRPAWVIESTPEELDLQIDVNFKGLVHGTRTLAQRMVTRRQGHIVNVASLAALAPVPGLSLYSASKHAVRAFSIAAAGELSERGVFVSVICPDAVATPMLDLQEDYPQSDLTFSGSRALTAEEVARQLCGPVLDRRPLELSLPTARGLTAKFGGLWPQAGLKLLPWFRHRGARARVERKAAGSKRDA